MKNIFLIIVLFISIDGLPQDPHLSQYFSAPLQLNPALTGNIDGEYRFQFAYRNQWWQNSFPYVSSIASSDFQILKNRLSGVGKLGIGLSVSRDASLSGAMKNSKIMLSTAYQQILDEDGFHSIGIGFQGGYYEKRINLNQIEFESQFTGDQFDLSINNNEQLSSYSQNIFDLNAGLLYSFFNGDNSFNLGFSFNNVLRPKFSFYLDSNSREHIKTMLHGSGNFFLNADSDKRFLFSFLIMQQAKSIEFNLGGAIGLNVGNNYLYFGAFNRFKDAIYPYVSFQTNSFQVGLSYDITTSYLKNYKPLRQSLELSFVFSRPDQSQNRKYMPWNY